MPKKFPLYLFLFLVLAFPKPGCGLDPVVVPSPSMDPVTIKTIDRDANPEMIVEPVEVIALIGRPDNLVPGGLIKLITDGSSGTVFAWSVPDNLPDTHYFVTPDQRVMVISPATAGTYYIGFVASDGSKVDVDSITVVVNGGTVPTPSPIPTPEPEPKPTPTPTDSIEHFIDQNAPQGTSAGREAAALASVYESVADLIRDKKLIDGPGAWGNIRNRSRDELLAVNGKASEDDWRKTLDGLYDLIISKTSGRNDMSGLESRFRESATGFRRITNAVNQYSQSLPQELSCPSSNCKPTTTTNIAVGSPTNSPKATNRPLRRLIAP